MRRAPVLLSILLALSACADDAITPPTERAPPQSPKFQIVGPIAQVSAGFTHTCALKTDETVQCWGANNYDQLSAPAGTFTQLSAGNAHSCAVASNLTIHCWGNSAAGRLDAPAGNFTQVSAAMSHTCAVAIDGSVHCWGGYNDHGELDVPSGDFTQVSAGEMHTCALASDGTIHCWGSNFAFQTDAPAGNNFRQVSAGSYHTCALADDFTVQCWGYNGFGQLNVPAGTFTQVSAGKGLEGQTCALAQSDGSLHCWGADQSGLLSPPAGSFAQVSLGGYHACVVAGDGSVQCWGDNWWGQTGEPASVFTSTDSPVVRPPEGNTGQPGDVTLTFETVTGSGQTTVSTSASGPEPPAGFQLGDPPVYYEITTTATYEGSIEICIDYSGQSFTSVLEIQHYEEINDDPPDSAWVTVPTTSHNLTNHIICGTVTSLSPFVLAQENTAPVASAGGPYTGGEGSAVALSLSGSDADGDVLTYAWDLGDGTMDTGDTPPTTHTYLDNGTYLITLTASDAYGGTHTVTTTATIANVAPSVGSVTAASEPVAVGTAVAVGADFTDPGTNDLHTAAIDWGEGTVSPASVSETGGSGSVTDAHSYATAGVYTVKVSVTDDDGGTGESVYEFVVVYDPSGGFVTGGGWIYSEPETYVADPSLEGKATFGFVSKYTKGAEELTGTTEFQFRAGNLNFHSTSYEWLVVTGSNYARFKGSGTINGAGDYRFMVWAGDGSPDTFRIRIWREDESTGVETVTYDNGRDQALGGGSIVVHAN